jgi:predicted lipoprotein with Yx(FWY)xxD motif
VNRKIIVGSSIAAVALATGIGVAAAASGGGSGPTGAAQPSRVGVTTTKSGQFLVDSQGRSLYLFEKDTGTASTCYSACAAIWPPLTVSAPPQAGTGVAAAKLGTTRRADGQTELTYNGHPLYYYVADTRPGQTQGQGLNQFGGTWHLVAPSGTEIDRGA